MNRMEDVKDLEDAIKKIPNFRPVMYKLDNSKMLKIIEDFIDNSSIMWLEKNGKSF